MTEPLAGQPNRPVPSPEPRADHTVETAEKWRRGLAWSRSPRALLVAGLLISVLLLSVVAFAQFVLAPATAVGIGITIVVLLGAGGLAARGVGELRDSREWKASGCFLCSAAYLGTASVALVNGVPLIFQQ